MPRPKEVRSQSMFQKEFVTKELFVLGQNMVASLQKKKKKKKQKKKWSQILKKKML
jgi:hypothetical protein